MKVKCVHCSDELSTDVKGMQYCKCGVVYLDSSNLGTSYRIGSNTHADYQMLNDDGSVIEYRGNDEIEVQQMNIKSFYAEIEVDRKTMDEIENDIQDIINEEDSTADQILEYVSQELGLNIFVAKKVIGISGDPVRK